MNEVAYELSQREPPVMFDRISTSNVADYAGLLNALVFLPPILKDVKSFPYAAMHTKVLNGTGVYETLEHYLYSTVRVKNKGQLGAFLGVQHAGGMFLDDCIR
jgi:hypothetical protein